MKKILIFLCSGVLISALGSACNGVNDQLPSDIIQPDPDANCCVFVTTTPGEEMILLAKSGITHKDALAIFADYESSYGEGNVYWDAGFQNGWNDNGSAYLENNPEAATNCYEITMTIDLVVDSAELTELAKWPEYAELSLVERAKKSLIDFGFRGVRIDDGVATCKWYDWAFTEDRIKELIPQYKSSFYEYCSWLGTIRDNVTIKKLGSELHNEPIVF